MKLPTLSLRRSFRHRDNTTHSFNYFSNQPGSVPGTLRIATHADLPELVLIDYNQDQATRRDQITPQECAEYLDTESVSWLDVAGLGSEEVLQQVGEVFSLHPLVLEDVVNVPQRPKIETYPGQLLIISTMVSPYEEGFRIEQVSLVLGKRYLLSIQEEGQWDNFQPVRDRVRNNQGVIRRKGADYLAYALWDAIIDGYFPIMERYGERLNDLEDEVVFNPTEITLAKIHQMRRELLALRRAIWPQRDALNAIIRDENELVGETVRMYLRDCYDHTVQLIDTIENYRELTSSLMDVYLSAASNKMNEIMKLLTIISSIFIPLTFIAGIYGMNFNTEVSPWNMPELNWDWGYPLCLAVMLLIAISLVSFFWRKGWFRNISNPKRL
jgi:magnesium transporter